LRKSQPNESIVPYAKAYYPDAFLEKSAILKDNKNKAGIYR
jgi:hypothetical protein